MTTKTLTASEAGQRARQAAEKADELESRLRDGDQKITAKQIADARLEAEHAALRAEGARTAEARQTIADIEERGNELHDEFVTEIVGDFEKVEAAVVAFQQATGGLLEAVDTYEDRRLGFKRRWNELFAGRTDLPTALKFKAGHRSGGDFGQLHQPGQVARKVAPFQLIVALLAEVISRYPGPLDGIDRGLRTQLNSGGYANGLQSLRELRRQLDKEKENNT